MVRRIVACGGQQLLYPALVRYVLGLARRRRPRVLFLGTASGDGAGYLLTFYQAFAGIDCEPSYLALFDRTVDDIDAFVRSQDVVIVGGGNTANMLAIWRLHGVESALRNAYAEGTVLSGWSAGCLCWFEGGVTDSFTPELGALRDGRIQVVAQHPQRGLLRPPARGQRRTPGCSNGLHSGPPRPRTRRAARRSPRTLPTGPTTAPARCRRSPAAAPWPGPSGRPAGRRPAGSRPLR